MIDEIKDFECPGFRNSDALHRDKIELLEGHFSKINTALITPDNKLIFTGAGLGAKDKDNLVRIWSVEEKKQVKVFNKHLVQVVALEITPDLSTVFSGDCHGGVFAWDFKSGKILSEVCLSGYIISMKFSPLDTSLYICISRSYLKIFKFQKENSTLKMTIKIQEKLTDFEFTRDFLSLIGKVSTGSFIIFDCLNKNIRSRINTDYLIDTNICFNSCSNIAVFGSYCSVRFFFVEFKCEAYEFKQTYPVVLLKLSDDFSKLISFTRFSAKIVRIPQLNILAEVNYIGNVKDISSDLGFFVTSQGKSFGLYSTSEGRQKALFKFHKRPIKNAFTYRGNSKILTQGLDSRLRIWDSSTLQHLSKIKLAKKVKTKVRLLDSRKYFIVLSANSIMTLN